ncbi:hypothetical protein WG926_17405 [Tistrella sp. BH-R2-4]|uniref:Uncharacterized protein n=1 Tax=Tistrella arctica TaxID=3133430 RepID=A0ABU9YMT8_9PROT
MNRIVIDPTRMRQFGAPDGAVFVLVTNEEMAPCFDVRTGPGYAGAETVLFRAGDRFIDMLPHLPERAHILVASPRAFFQSPPSGTVGDGRKLIAMACNSTPTDIETLRHFVAMVEATDPDAQQIMVDRLFHHGERTPWLDFHDARHGTHARFNHLSEAYRWNEQAGILGWGEQQLAPSGEVSVLPLHIWDFDTDLSLDIEGELIIEGRPILHHGAPSYHPADQARIYGRLASIADGPILARVTKGAVTGLEALTPAGRPAVDMLERMFDIDSRYRALWEIGFAVNTALRLYDGNTAMNEVYGGVNGTIHLGLGLTPYTQYHLDIICPHLSVMAADGEVIFGAPIAADMGEGTGVVGRMSRERSAACGCLT